MTTSLRTSALVSGISLALMAALAPLFVAVALPAGETGVAAIIVLTIAVLDVIVAIALYPILVPGGLLLAQLATAMRVAYGAVFAVAAGSLLAPADVEQFQAVWDASLFIFGVALVLVGLAVVRGRGLPTWIGLLVIIAGFGYATDAVIVAIDPGNPVVVSQFTFIGEVVLLIWLIGWGGRARHRDAVGAP
ncbi:DUF4386 domain-containing protein [Microcella sp.]|uniref:DUF4386 domain-containing protein n=1 Tax=Microcella sp. TaxID=1913979 RepID=UPI003F731143